MHCEYIKYEERNLKLDESDLLRMSRLVRNRVKVVLDDFKFIAVEFRHRRWRNILSIGSIEVAIECCFIKVTVFSLIKHRLSFVQRAGDASHVNVDLEIAFAIFWHQLDTLLMHVVVTIVALKSLLEQTSKELLAKLTNCWSRVRVNLKCVWNLHSRNCSRAAAI